MSAPAQPESASAGSGGRVMIIEDDPDGGESMKVLLRLYGYEVERAVDLESALALALAPSLRPQAVLMEVALPGVDGYEVARRLRAQPGSVDTVFIGIIGIIGISGISGISGFGQPDDMQRSAEAGFLQHLVKPVNPDELDALLSRHLKAEPVSPTPDEG